MIKINTIKNNMREIRFHKNLTLDDVFLRTDIWGPKLSRIERGILKPSLKERQLIAKALRSKVEEIFPDA